MANRYVARFRSLSKVAPENGIVLFGDSDVQHWRDEGKLPGWGVFCGVNGARMEDMADFVEEMVTVLKPRAVVAVGGENDIAEINTVPEKAVQRFVEVLATHGVPLLILGCKPEPCTRALWPLYLEYDDVQRAAVDTHPTATFLDFWYMKNEKLYSHDELHLSKKGYDEWNTRVAETLQEMGIEV